jgi:hypothetical protein
MQFYFKGYYMKKIALSLIVTSVSLLAYNEYVGHGETTDSKILIENQTVVNNIVADTPKTNFITSGKNYGAAAQVIYGDEVSILNIPLGMRIGYGFGVEASIPLVDNSNSSESGIGDVSIGGNYYFGGLFESTGQNITSLLYKTTTGDETKGLGTGVDAISLSHSFTKNIGDKYTANALLSYTINDDTVSGDSYMAMVGGSMPCLVSDKVTTSAKLTYFNIAENQYNFGELSSADLWIQWDSTKLVNNLPLGFGVKVPLLNEVDGISIDKTLLFYLSVASFF